MVSGPEYQAVLKAVSDWPLEDRAALVHDLLNALRRSNPATHAPRCTLNLALGLGKTGDPPPTDDDVHHWIAEHRQEKYGG